jgi:hypothetical protein
MLSRSARIFFIPPTITTPPSISVVATFFVSAHRASSCAHLNSNWQVSHLLRDCSAPHRRGQLPARAFSNDSKGGVSTKQRSAIPRTNSSSCGETNGSSCGGTSSDSKLIYRSPLTLIKLFRSLALIQTAGCIVGCSTMLWKVSPLLRVITCESHITLPPPPFPHVFSTILSVAMVT